MQYLHTTYPLQFDDVEYVYSAIFVIAETLSKYNAGAIKI